MKESGVKFNTSLTLSWPKDILGKFSFTKSSINQIWLLPFWFMIYQNDYKDTIAFDSKQNLPKFLSRGGGRATKEGEVNEKSLPSMQKSWKYQKSLSP